MELTAAFCGGLESLTGTRSGFSEPVAEFELPGWVVSILLAGSGGSPALLYVDATLSEGVSVAWEELAVVAITGAHGTARATCDPVSSSRSAVATTGESGRLARRLRPPAEERGFAPAVAGFLDVGPRSVASGAGPDGTRSGSSPGWVSPGLSWEPSTRVSGAGGGSRPNPPTSEPNAKALIVPIIAIEPAQAIARRRSITAP